MIPETVEVNFFLFGNIFIKFLNNRLNFCDLEFIKKLNLLKFLTSSMFFYKKS